MEINIPNKKSKTELKQKRKELQAEINSLNNKQNKDEEDNIILQSLIITDSIIGINLNKQNINGVKLNTLYDSIDNVINKHKEHKEKKKNKNK